MSNLYFTWLGPPQPANLTVAGIMGQQRKDTSAILRMHQMSFKGGPPPNLTLCVLKKFETQFRAQLPQTIDILPIEDAFSTKGMLSIVMSRPDMGNLDATVDYIVRETLGVRGTGYSPHLLPTKKLAFIKDLWSLYCLWKFGGYHLDSGCFPHQAGGALDFPAPQRFGAPDVLGTDSSAFTQSQVRLQTGLTKWVMLRNSHLKMEALQGKVTDGQTYAPLKRMVDVWFLRGPKNDPVARTALETYVQGWFEIQRWAKTVEERKAEVVGARQLRELVVSSVLTGLTYHQGRTRSKQESESFLLQVSQNGLPEFGIHKVHFRSHRD